MFQEGPRESCCISRSTFDTSLSLTIYQHVIHYQILTLQPRERHLIAIKRASSSDCDHDYRRKLPYPSILITNARSVRNKMDEIRLLLSKYAPGLAIFSESWLDDTTDDSFLSIPNYSVLRTDRNFHGGGLLGYCDLQYHPRICDCLDLNIIDCNTNFLCFYIKLRILVIAIYHPYWGSSSCHDLVIDKLIDVVKHGMDAHSTTSVIICGDFNGLSGCVPQLNSLFNTDSLFDFNTRDSNQLDFILCDRKNLFLKPKKLSPIGRSDHLTVFCPTSCASPVVSTKKICFRKKYPSSCANFANELRNAYFLKNIYSIDDVSAAAELLSSELLTLIDKHFPFRTVKIRSDDKPWVKPSLKYLINKRDRAYSQGKKLKYLRLREAVIRHSHSLKHKFLQTAIDEKCPKKQWRRINDLLHRHKYGDPSVNAHDLASIFSSVYVDANRSHSINFHQQPSSPISFDENDVSDILRKLKKGSTGPDNIPFWILRDFRSILAPSITFICKLSTSSGIVPSCYKRAIISPIPKCASPSLRDYRPISLLPVISKVLEKLVFLKWIKPLVVHIHPSQFAFVPRQGQGTTCALTYIVHNILSFLDSPGAVRLLMVDYSKAFDVIPHDVILEALISINAPNEFLMWLSSYLSSRFQRVRCGDNLSNWFPASSGVPQGSVLGPVLFAFAINGLQPHFNNSLLVKYADDISLLHFVRNNEDDCLLEEFNHLRSWSVNHGLFLNASKTKVMDFKTKRSLVLKSIHDSTTGTHIESLKSSKLLGITLDVELRWDIHVNNLLSKLRKKTYLLHSLRHARPGYKVLRTVYTALFRSVSSYAFPAWCNVTATRFHKLVKFEKRMCKMFNFNCSQDLPSFCNSMAFKLAEKAKHCQHPLNFIYEQTSSRYSQRLKNNHRKIKAKTKRYHNSFIKFA